MTLSINAFLKKRKEKKRKRKERKRKEKKKKRNQKKTKENKTKEKKERSGWDSLPPPVYNIHTAVPGEKPHRILKDL